MTPSPIITAVELTSFTVALDNIASDAAERGASYKPGASRRHTRFAVRIHTDAGISGCYVPPRSRVMVAMPACRFLANLLIGKPALERERHYQAMRRATKHVGELGIGPLDIALWDLAGKLQNVSVAQMLGAYRWRLPAYASTMGGDRQPDGHENLADMTQARAQRRPMPISQSAALSWATLPTRCTAGRPGTWPKKARCCAPSVIVSVTGWR